MIICLPNHASKALHVLLHGNPDLTVKTNVFLTTEVLKFFHNSAGLVNYLVLLCLAPLVNKGSISFNQNML